MAAHQDVALQRRLGTVDAAAIIVSNVIGGGIFFVPQLVAALVPNPMAMLGVWLVGGLLVLAGAMAYAELATLRPRAGGEYVYLREAFGPLAAFLTGWTSFVAGFSGAIAAVAVGFAEYLGRFVPAAANATALLTIPLGLTSLEISPKTLVALTVIAVLSCVHIAGVGPGRLVQNTLATFKVGGLVALVLLGLTIGKGSTAHLTAAAGPAPFNAALLALIPVMFSYSGWNAAAYVAEEIRDPARNVPRALALGTGIVVLLYLALNVLYVYALPVAEMAKLSGGLLDAAADRLFTFALGNWITLFTLVSMAASISAMIFAGPRVYFAMARDGLFFESARRVHARFNSPSASIVAQGLWSAVLVMSGTLSQLVSYTGFAVVLFSGIAVAGLFVLRRRNPTEHRPYSVWGYPVAPAVFVIAAALMVLNEVWQRPGPALTGVTVILAGIPLYLFFVSRNSRNRVAGQQVSGSLARRPVGVSPPTDPSDPPADLR